MARTWVVAGIAAVATAVVVVGGALLLWPDADAAGQADAATGQRTMVVNGNITLTTTHIYHWAGQQGEPCYGTGPYKDMNAGAQVKVFDAQGAVVATGELREGRWGVGCVFPFSVKDVPESNMIQVEVGNRGKVPFDLDAVKNGGVKLTLGP